MLAAKKVSLTACQSGNLYLGCISPGCISPNSFQLVQKTLRQYQPDSKILKSQAFGHYFLFMLISIHFFCCINKVSGSFFVVIFICHTPIFLILLSSFQNFYMYQVLAVFEEIHVNVMLYILVFGESLLNGKQ